MLANQSYVIEMLNKPHAAADDEELYWPTLVLCARGLHAQGKNSYVATMVYLMLCDCIKTRETSLIIRCILSRSIRIRGRYSWEFWSKHTRRCRSMGTRIGTRQHYA